MLYYPCITRLKFRKGVVDDKKTMDSNGSGNLHGCSAFSIYTRFACVSSNGRFYKSGVTGVYFRETPGGTPIKDSNGNTIYLNGGQALTIQDTSNSSWYKVTLTYNGGSYTGYVSSQYVVAGAAPTPSTPSGDADFEAKLSAQGFPDSYKLICVPSMRNTQTGNFGRFRPGWIGIHL